MDRYPEYVSGTGRPLVFILGTVDNEPDLHPRLIRLFDTVHNEIGNNEISPLHFKAVPNDFHFTEKKAPKENLSVDGVLKFSWPLKHFEQIPSVVLFCVPFGVDWSTTEWTRRELAVQDKLAKLKMTLATREVKVIVLMFKVGAGALEKEVLDERISTFKRHAQTDSKTFVYFNMHELVADNTSVRRLYKTIREGSFSYYASNIKRFKTIEKSIGDKFKGPYEHMLLARYCFKIAFFNEFQGQMNYSLRFYRQSYNHLATCLESVNEDLFEQVKAVAEIAHFKACRLLLLQKSVDEAFQQFRNHILIFTKLYSKHPWRHSAWTADQFLVFCQLLDRFSISDTLPYADRSFYYQNAARFTIDRMHHFLRSKKDVSPAYDTDDTVVSLTPDNNSPATSSELTLNQVMQTYAAMGRWKIRQYRGRVFCPPRFVGGVPHIVPGSSSSVSEIPASVSSSVSSSVGDTVSLYFDYLYALESRVVHHKLTNDLLIKALSSLPAAVSQAGTGAVTTVGANPRRKAMLFYMMAQQAARQGDHEAALGQLCPGVSLLLRDRWFQACMPLLLAVTSSAIALGRAKEYIDAALSLYANSAYVYFSRHDLEELHLNVLCLCHHSLLHHLTVERDTLQDTERDIEKDKEEADCAVSLTQLPYVSRPQSFLTTTYAPLVLRKDFGSHSKSDTTDLRFLPNGHALHFDRDCRLFEVETAFDRASVELGEELRLSVTIKSLFLDNLIFDELELFSFDDIVQRKFLHRATHDTPDASDTTTDETAETLDLCLQPFQPLTFTVSWHVTEAVFAKYLAKDAIFGVDRLELRWRRTSSISTSKSPKTRQDTVSSSVMTFRVSACPTDLHDLRRQHSLSTTTSNTTSTSSGTTSTNTVAPVSVAFQWSLKEVFSFSRLQPLHKPPVCRILKPSKLLSLVRPLSVHKSGVATQSSDSLESGVSLLQGLLQRVDVVLAVGTHDLRAVKVYLSSDIPTQNSSSGVSGCVAGCVADVNANHVFYLPDMPELLRHTCDTGNSTNNNNNNKQTVLSETHTETHSETQWHANQVGFFPMRLNAAQQPLLPLVVEGRVAAHSSLLIPLFVRVADSVTPDKRYTLTLSVECVPTDVMTSAAIAGEFSVSVTVRRPFQIQPLLRCHSENVSLAARHIGDTSASPQTQAVSRWCVAEKTQLSLDTSITCLHTLPPCDTDDTSTRKRCVKVYDIEHSDCDTRFVQRVSPVSQSVADQNDVEISDKSNKKKKRPFLVTLRHNETFRRSFFFSATDRDRDTQSGGGVAEGSLGHYTILWRDRNCHPLKSPLSVCRDTDKDNGKDTVQDTVNDTGFFPRHSSGFHWLLFAHPRPDVFSEVSLSDTAERDTPSGGGATPDVSQWHEEVQRVWNEVVESAPERRVSVTASTVVSLPLLQVVSQPFHVSLHTPATIVQNERFTLSVKVRRPFQNGFRDAASGFSRGVEKLKVVVSLHEDFLLAGATSSAVEVVEDLSAAGDTEEGEEVVRVTCVALRPGWVSLPRVQLLWDKQRSSTSSFSTSSGTGNSNVANNNIQDNCVFDLGDKDESRPRLFVLPAVQSS